MNESCKLICFTSACGGVGTTSTALCMGRSLSRLKEVNTLFISLDFLSCKCGRGNLEKSQLFDVLAGEESSPDSFLSSLCEDEFGLKSLSFAELVNPLHSAIDKLEFLVSGFSDSFDCIIIDCPSNCSLGLALYRLCDSIVLVDGFRESAAEYNLKLMKFFQLYTPDSQIFEFRFEEDSEGFSDIHGQFGAEVRGLADKIFDKKDIGPGPGK